MQHSLWYYTIEQNDIKQIAQKGSPNTSHMTISRGSTRNSHYLTLILKCVRATSNRAPSTTKKQPTTNMKNMQSTLATHSDDIYTMYFIETKFANKSICSDPTQMTCVCNSLWHYPIVQNDTKQIAQKCSGKASYIQNDDISRDGPFNS
jgi:hypothetical protein